jgi:hypothetical protein
MSERGTITEWDAAQGWGSLRLDDGTELRFKHNACADGMTPAIGAVVYVLEHLPYLGAERRATAISPTAIPAPTPFDGVRFRSEVEAELVLRITREVGRFFDSRPHGRVPHFDRVLAELGIAVDTSILDTNEAPLVLYEPEALGAWTPFDPCFVSFGGSDGDAWGALCHPALLARGEAPIVMWSHDGAPITFEAPTFAAWLPLRAAETESAAWLAARGVIAPAPAPAPTDTLAAAVRAIVAGEPPAVAEERAALAAYLGCAWTDWDGRVARLDELIAIYRRLGWPAPLIERAVVQRASVVAEGAHAAAVARITREHRAAYPDVYRDG